MSLNPFRKLTVTQRAAPISLAGAMVLLTAVGVHAQQPSAPSAAEPCLGYAYNIRPTPMVPSGIQTVAQVLPATPAEAGGLRVGDLLVSVNGLPVSAGSPSLVPGDTIPFVVSRTEGNVVLQMVVGQREPDGTGEMVCRPHADAVTRAPERRYRSILEGSA